jgi:hypothetical protein
LLIIVLLSVFGNLDRLRRLVVELHAQPSLRRRDRQLAIAELAHEVEGLSRRPLVRHAQRVVRDALLDRRAHLGCCAEESIRRHETLDALMGTMEVVRVDEEFDAPLTVGEVGEDGFGEKLIPKRLPKTLDLSERLRMLRAALDVTDAFASQLLLEFRLAPPRRVLSSLVGQDLARRTVRRDAASQRLHHELAPLVVGQRVRDDEARVVVHEAGEVEPIVASKQKREDVRLPELVRLRSLEASHGMLACTVGRRTLFEQALVVEDATVARLTDADAFTTRELVTDATRAPLWMTTPDLQHPLAHFVVVTLSRRWSTAAWSQTLDAVTTIRRDPRVDRRARDPEGARDLIDAQMSAKHLAQHRLSLSKRICVAAMIALAATALSSL